MVIIALCLGIIFTGSISFFGARWVLFIYGTGQVSPDMEMPMWIVYLAIPFGSGLMCYRFMQVLTGFIKNGTLPTHSFGGDDMEAAA